MPYLGITVRRVGRLLFSKKKEKTNKQKTEGSEKKGSIYALYFHCQKTHYQVFILAVISIWKTKCYTRIVPIITRLKSNTLYVEVVSC